MKKASLCFLIDERKEKKRILLAMKKRGFGKGKWNGVGGKLKEGGDKNITETAIRETEEEIGVKVKALKKMAVLNFYFPYVPQERGWDQEVHVFLINDWQGKIRETEEMAPRWFKENEVPFEKMWADDKFWLPYVLKGQRLKADFTFRKGELVRDYNIDLTKEV